MKIRRLAGTVALLSLVLTGLVAQPASADTANPVVVLDSGTVSPSTIAPGGQITVSWRVTDDANCCSWVRVHIHNDGSPTNDAIAWNDSATLVSGTTTDGTYRTTFNIPQLANGTYEFRAQVIDQAGKYSNFGRVARFTVGQLAVDAANPVVVIDSGVASPATVAPGGQITASWRVTDDLDCCSWVRIHIHNDGSPTNNAIAWNDSATLVSGTNQDGTYRTTFNIPALPNGVYELRAQVIDKAGKYSNFGRVARFTVGQPVVDAANPVVVVDSGTASPSTVASGGQITATWRVTDDLDCCSWVRVHIHNDGSPNNNAIAWNDSAILVSGDSRDGTYRTTFNIPTLPNGVYELRAQVIDKAGKYSNFGRVARFTVGQPVVDSANPVIVLDSGAVSDSTVAPAQSLTVTWRVTDDLDCCSFNRINFVRNGDSTNAVVWFADNPTLVAGNEKSGTYSRTFLVPAIPDGVYELKAQVTDKAGKYSGLDRVARVTVSRTPTDLANPVLDTRSGTVSKSQVRVGETVTVTWRITDDVDCCNFNRLNIMPAGGSNLDILYREDRVTRISGDGKDGVYSATFAVPNLPLGNYSLRAQATDKQNKYTNLSEIATFTIVSQVDQANPVVVPSSGVVFPATANPGSKVTLQYQVTDDLDCCNPHDAYMYDAQGNWVIRNQARLVSGTKTNGTYQVDFTLPSNLQAGVYTFRSQVTDKAGKFSELQLLGSVRVSTLDLQDPVILPNSGTLSKASLVTGDVLTVSYQATDDVGGFAPHSAFIFDENNNLVLRANAAQISGDELRSTFRAVFSLGETLASGRYTVRSQVTDNSGRYSNLQLIGSFTFASTLVRKAEIVRSTGLASPNLVRPGAIVRISFTVLNDNSDVSASASIKNSSQRTIASATAIRLFRGVGSSQFYADVRVPSNARAGTLIFSASVVDGVSGQSENVDLGTFQVQSSYSSLQAPRNLRFNDGLGLSPSSLVWDNPSGVSNSAIGSYLVEAMTIDGEWNQLCSTSASNRVCLLNSRNISEREIVAYRVAAIGIDGPGAFGSISHPSTLRFVGDPIFTPASQGSPMPQGATINVTTRAGRIIVSTTGLAGYRITWNIEGRTQQALVTKQSQSFTRSISRRGVRTKIEVFVNDSRTPAFTRTVATR